MKMEEYIYVPEYNNNQCLVILDKDTLRLYDSINLEQENTYTDYYINSHYLFNSNTEILTQEPQCIDSNLITTDFYYRNDLDSILICFLIILLIAFYLPFRVMARLYKRVG